MSYLTALRVIVSLHVKRILCVYNVLQHLRVHKHRMGSTARTQFLRSPKLCKRQDGNRSKGECGVSFSALPAISRTNAGTVASWHSGGPPCCFVLFSGRSRANGEALEGYLHTCTCPKLYLQIPYICYN